MSTIGFPDWGLSYRYPINPTQCIVFAESRHDGATATTTIYTLAPGEVVVVAAMAVGLNYSIVGDAWPFTGIFVTAGVDGSSAGQQLIIAELASHSIDTHNYNQGLATEADLPAAIAIAGGASGNTIEWNYALAGTTSISAFCNAIIYKTS